MRSTVLLLFCAVFAIERTSCQVPTFETDNHVVSINQNALNGSLVSSASCAYSGMVRYRIESFAPNIEFLEIDGVSGEIFLTKDSFELPEGNLTIALECYDPNDQTRNDISTFVVMRVEENEFPPQFSQNGSIQVDILETLDHSTNPLIYTISATDNDRGIFGNIIYTKSDSSVFIINSENGEIRLQSALDYDTTSRYQLVVTASNPAQNGMMESRDKLVVIDIIDVDDEAPVFSENVYQVQVHETYTEPSPPPFPRPSPGFFAIQCDDVDTDEASITYSVCPSTICSFSDPGPFELDTSTGDFSVSSDLDYETRTSYSVSVLCYDNSEGNHSAMSRVDFAILPVNEHVPIAGGNSAVFFIGTETDPVGTEIIAANDLECTDMDDGPDGEVMFTIQGPFVDLFSVNSSTGEVSLQTMVDYEFFGPMVFPVLFIHSLTCCDVSPPRSECPNFEFTVFVQAVNEFMPDFLQRDYTVSVSESLSVGSVILNATCIDEDFEIGASQGILFSDNVLDNIRSKFHVDMMGIVTTIAELDYEFVQNYAFDITCSDGQYENSATVHVIVEPENDNEPVFDTNLYFFNVSRTTPSDGFFVGQIVAEDNDRDFGGTLTYTLESNGFFDVTDDGDILLINSVFNLSDSQISFNANVSDGVFIDDVFVVVTLTEGNMNSPRFQQRSRTIEISELLPIGTSLTQLTCIDDETGVNGEIRYYFADGNTNDAFTICESSGVVSVGNSLVLAQGTTSEEYPLSVVCEDHGVPILSDDIVLQIRVVQDDLNPPEIGNDTIIAFISEDAAINDVVVTILATDLDLTQLNYRIENASVPGVFIIDPQTGDVTVAALLDREEVSRYEITVVVNEEGAQRFDSALLVILVRDVNDNSPTCEFETPAINIQIPETLSVGSVILQLNCTDLDVGNNAELVFFLDNDFEVLQINDLGELFLQNPLNFTNSSVLEFFITVSDMGEVRQQNSYQAVISIASSNRNVPMFLNIPETISISEAQLIGEIIFTVRAEDPDRGTFGQVLYSIENVNEALPFTIFQNTGRIFLNSMLDFFQQQQYVLNISASDSDFTVTETLTVVVLDENEFPPICDSLMITGTVAENLGPDQLVTDSLSCSDMDEGSFGQLMYTITSGNINEVFIVLSDGGIVAAIPLDFEVTEQYDLVVEVSDVSMTPMAINVLVSVLVQPVNEFRPMFGEFLYEASLPENSDISQSVLTVNAIDMDRETHPHGQITYSLMGLVPPFFSISSTGLIQLTGNLDRETQSSYVFSVIASDQGVPPMTGVATINITVTDIDDNPPTFQMGFYPVSLNGSTISGSRVTDTVCFDADVGTNAAVDYSIAQQSDDSEFFTIDSTGLITVLDDLPVSKTYTFSVRCVGPAPANLSDTAVVSVQVVVDSNITFLSSMYIGTVQEDADPVVDILTVMALSSTMAPLTYTLLDDEQSSQFSINRISGVLQLISAVDHESTPEFLLQIQASDNGNPPNLAEVFVQIIVQNVNDNIPEIDANLTAIELLEGFTSAPITIAQYRCRDNDNGTFGQVNFHIASGNIGGVFSISSAGTLQLVGNLDFETQTFFSLQIVCEDGGENPERDTVLISVNILPANDNPPQFASETLTIVIDELLPLSSFISTPITATDLDLPPHNSIRYSIISGNTNPETFFISPAIGQLMLINTLDYESVVSYTLTVLAEDGGGLPDPEFEVLNDTIEIEISVRDANDNSPMLNQESYTGTISENAMVGDQVVLTAPIVCIDLDSDANGETTLTIQNTHFMIENTNVIVRTELDFEAISSIQIVSIICSDNGSPPLTTEARLFITVLDVNEFGPEFINDVYNFSVSENVTVGTTIGGILAIDGDAGESGVVTYSFFNSTGTPFTIDSDSGEIMLVSSLDYETQSQVYVYVAIATDLVNNDTTTVFIQIENIDDNLPTFTQSEYFSSVPENAEIGTIAGQVSCSDADDEADGILVVYSLQGGSSFQIEPRLGTITVSGDLDLETIPRYQLSAFCMDSDGNSVMVDLTVDLLPFNDFPPVFIGTPYIVDVFENGQIGISVFQVHATDNDNVGFNTIAYSLIGGNEASVFSIDSTSGIVRISQLIDREQQEQYEITVQAQNIIPPGDTSGSPALSANTGLNITVLDENDNSPVIIPSNPNPVFILESSGPGTVVEDFTCVDADSGMNGETDFTISSASISESFEIYENGTLVTTDFIRSNVVVDVTCRDNGVLVVRSTTVSITINTVSMNDHAPEFPQPFYELEVREDQPIGVNITCITATDLDGPDTPDGIVQYSLQLQSSVGSPFGIRGTSGCIFATGGVDIELGILYRYVVIAMDMGQVPQNATTILHITVLDVIRDPPSFNNAPYTREVSEGVAIGAFLLQITCDDPDLNDMLTYNITSGNPEGLFMIDNSTGDILVASRLDFESAISHTLEVVCIDLSAFQDVTNVFLTVLPVNEHTPSFLSQPMLSIPEHSIGGTRVTTLSYHDGDAGSDGEVVFDIVSGNIGDVFTITDDGQIIVTNILDRESRNFYSLQVQITDLSPLDQARFSVNFVNITVTDINDQIPMFEADLYVFGTLEGSEDPGYVVGTVQCNDGDIGSNAEVQYQLMGHTTNESLFNIESASGDIVVVGDLNDREFDNITFFVECVDSGVRPLTGTARVLVAIVESNLHPPVFTNSSYNVDVPEDARIIDDIIVTVEATDRDTGVNGLVRYSLQETFNNQFFIDQDSGDITLLRSLDFESVQEYDLLVEAVDGAMDSLLRRTSTAEVFIHVIGVNEFTPVCARPVYVTVINETVSGDILNLGCTDDDEGDDGALLYIFTSGNDLQYFQISNGILTIPDAILPNISVEQYILEVSVSDSGNMTRSTEVDIIVIYSFDNIANPTFDMSEYFLNASEFTEVGEILSTFLATDTDPSLQGQVSYIVSQTQSFRISPMNGDLFLARPLDWETEPIHEFTVIAVDSDPFSPNSGSATIIVSVINENDNPPECDDVFFAAEVFSNAGIDETVILITCSDQDQNPLFYELVTSQTPFSVNISTGRIFVSEVLTPSNVILSVIVSDGELSIEITVNVAVLFENVEAPVFTEPEYTFSIAENAPLLSSVGIVVATDADSENADLLFSVLAPVDELYLNPFTGVIQLTAPLDYEMSQGHIITVQVEDRGGFNGSTVLSDTATVVINIENVNDHSPLLNGGGVYGATVSESVGVGTSILSIMCTDGDDDPFGTPSVASISLDVPFQLVGPEFDKILEVSQVLQGPSSYVINVSCSDGGGLTTSGQIFLFVPEPDAPQFTASVYEWLLSEGSMSGSEYSDIQAVSNDGSDVSYSISDGNDNGIFFIDPSNGVVSLVTSIDYETQRTHGLIVRAVDSSNRQASVLLLVQVLNENDEISLTPPTEFFTVPHNAPIGSPIGSLECLDADETNNATQFNFTFIPMSSTFSVDENGVVRLEEALDDAPVHVLPVVCFDEAATDSFSTGIVTIEVDFLNLESPVFQLTSYTFSVQENLEPLTFVGSVIASDGDVGSFGELSYSITAGNPDKFFIDAATGDIHLLTGLDREILDSYILTVIAFDGGVSASDTDRRTGTTTVVINVEDVNDNTPTPAQLTNVAYITTNHSELSPVVAVNCTDSDLQSNAVVDYFLEPESPDFVIQSSGTILLAMEQHGPAVYNLNAVCRDRGIPVLSSSVLVTVIIDVFEVSAPVFETEGYNVTIPEDQPIASTIVQVIAISSNENENIVYFISAGNDGGSFHVNPSSGEIILIAPLDASAQSLYLISIEASVAERSGISSFATVRISVVDVNDNTPMFTSSFYVSRINETANLFTPVIQVVCNDSDTNSEISYSITGGLSSTTFNITQEGIIVVADVIDYEIEILYTIEVTCNDGGDTPRFATTSVRIEVLPVNEYLPEFLELVYYFQAFEHSFGSLIGAIEAIDNDSGSDGSVLYFLEDPGSFSVVFVEPFTGEVLVSSNLDFEQQQVWNLTVIARDGGGAESHARLNIEVININDVQPVITPTAVVRSVLSDAPFGYPIQLYSCADEDGSSTTLSIVNENDFFMLSDTGVIVWTAMADNLTSNFVISLTLTCQDTEALDQIVDAHIAITIRVGDVSPPLFSSALYTAVVNEATPLNTTVVTVSAIGENQDIFYSLFSLPLSFPFQVNRSSGDVVLTSSLDRETEAFYSFFVRATDQMSAAVGISLVEITVTDFNDNAPQILPGQQNIIVSEALSSGTLISFSCTDDDSQENGDVNFQITSGNEMMFFNIDSNGDISLAQQLDFETTNFYNLTVVCFDSAPNPLSDTATLLIEVLGVNEHAPVFENSSYSFDINEYTQAGQLVGIVNAVDDDSVIGSTVFYSITSGSGVNYFTINSIGEIHTTNNPLNATDILELLLTVRATDEGMLSDDAAVDINIIDINEQPTFAEFSNQLILNSTEVALSTILLEVFCFDTDLGRNAELALDIVGLPGLFMLQTETFLKGISGSILTNSTLPAGSFEVFLQCSDNGTPPLHTNTSVAIRVEGDNTPPFFLHGVQIISILEDTETGTPVVSVDAQDLETNVTYAIIGGNGLGTFEIDDSTGDISLVLPLDYEITTNLELTVAVYDQAVFNRMSATTEVLITISNVNDIDPIIDPAGIQVITVSESIEASTVVKDYTCIDPDGQLTEFLISSEGTSPFSISQSGSTGYVTLQTTVDYEVQTMYSLMIMCRDTEVRPGEGLRRQVTAVLIVHVLPVNMFAPTFISLLEIFLSESTSIGEIIGSVEAVDFDGRGEITYTGISDNFIVDPITGNISLIGGLDYETSQLFIIDVSATDNDNVLGIMPRSTTVQLTIIVTDVNDNQPVCEMHTLQTQLETGTYSFVPLAELDCSDQDDNNNSVLMYAFIESTVPVVPNGMFVLNGTTGDFGFTGTISFTDTLTIAVNVSDSGDVPLSSQVNIFVQVVSTNLSTPHFNPDSFFLTISENTTSFIVFNGSLLSTALVNPANDPVEFALRANPLYNGAFIIDFSNGNIMLTSATLLDFDEGIQNYSLIVEATVGSTVPSAIVNIVLTDFNDNAPRFSQTSYNASVLENQNAGIFVLHVEATDIDSGLNSQLLYEVDDTIAFTIDVLSGRISTVQSFDREVNERYFFYALARDMGSPQLTGVVPITVTVLDENDEPPMFTQSIYIRDIDNISPPGSELLTLEVVDADITNSFIFQIITDNPEVRNLFTVDSPQGILRQRSVNIPVDHQPVYNFTVEVNDGRLTDVAEVIVYVATVTSDVAVFEENVPGQKYDAAEFLILQEFNITSNAIYEIEEGDDFNNFRVFANGTLTTTGILDRENISEYEINIHIVDSTSSENVNLYVTVIVVDQNDNAPSFSTSQYTFFISEGNYPELTVVGGVLAIDIDAPGTGASAIQYSLVQQSDFFDVDRTNGEVFIQAGSTLDREMQDTHTLTIRARDFGEPTAMTTFTMVVITLQDINDNDPEFIPVDILEFLVEADNRLPANTTLELIAVLPDSIEILLSSFDFVDRDSTSNVTLTLATVRGESKFRIVHNNLDAMLVTTESISLQDNGTLLQVILRDEPADEEQRPVVRNITVIVSNATVTAPPSTTATTEFTGTASTAIPTVFFETEIGIAVIVVICALIFALLFFFCTLGCYCYLRIRREKDPLRNRDRTTTVAQRLLTETDRRGRKGFGKPWQYYSYSDIDKIDFPEFSPDDPDTQYLYGPGEFESSFMDGSYGAGQGFNDPFMPTQQESPSTGTSVLTNPVLDADEESDDDPNRMYTMGPVLRAMLEEWDRGDELLKKQKKKKSKNK